MMKSILLPHGKRVTISHGKFEVSAHVMVTALSKVPSERKKPETVFYVTEKGARELAAAFLAVADEIKGGL
jgi:hypothetical protein